MNDWSAPSWLMITPAIGLFYVTLAGALITALARGGAPEKRGALVLATMLIWQLAAYAVVPPRYISLDDVAVIADVFGMLGFGYIACNALRLWPIWASSFQLLSLSGHFARAVELSFDPIIYSWMKSLPTAGAIIALLAGTLAHIRRIGRYGDDPSWQDWQRIEHAASIRRRLRSSRP